MKQQGFAHAVLIVGMAVALIGALGFIFWQNFIYTEPTAKVNEVTTVEKSYTLADAKQDIKVVLAADSSSCAESDDSKLSIAEYETVDSNGVYTEPLGKSAITDDFSFARVIFGCGTQGFGGYLARTNSEWSLVDESASYPLCSKIRTASFPAVLVDQCYRDDGSGPVSVY